MKISLQAGLLLGTGMLTAFSSVVAFAQYDMTNPMQVPPASSSFSSMISSPIYPPVPAEGSEPILGDCTCGKTRIQPSESKDACLASKRNEDDYCIFISGNNPKCICTEYTVYKNLKPLECDEKNNVISGTSCIFSAYYSPYNPYID